MINDENPHIGIEYGDSIGATFIEDFKQRTDKDRLKFFERSRPSEEIYMGHEWVIPTAIAVYILKPYFETFLKEMAKDHYIILKKSVKKLANKSKNEIKTTLIASSEGKIDKENPFTSSFSINYFDKNERLSIKFLFRASASDEQISEASDYFLDLLKEYNYDKEKSTLNKLLKKLERKANPILICYNENIKEAMILDMRDKVNVKTIASN